MTQNTYFGFWIVLCRKSNIVRHKTDSIFLQHSGGEVGTTPMQTRCFESLQVWKNYIQLYTLGNSPDYSSQMVPPRLLQNHIQTT